MKLTVIIVNYNVKYFLEQCLFSVRKAQMICDKKFEYNSTEVFVVDNNSSDGSLEMLNLKFPEIKRIDNKKNVGFAVANNQAIKESTAEYVLLLNPDTLVAEDTFVKIIDFMDEHPDAGGLGITMIDGKGRFLPESKRSFPTPSVSFYKMFGFSKLFPKSKKFSKYHLNYLDKTKTHQVDVLSGAFMMLRKEALTVSGLLDEDFFMYGEDIDLSYRIIKAGFKNYYFSDSSIIHYKGESTKKGSLNYVFMFYNAMIIFAEKHFSNKKIAFFSIFIRLAVLLRAGLSAFKRIFNVLFLPISDAILFYLGFYLIKPAWEIYKFKKTDYYPEEYLQFAVPVYIGIWLISIFISKGYKKPIDSKKLFKGILFGAFVILVFYSLLSEEYRYSRALLLLGTIWALMFSWLLRAVFTILNIKTFSFRKMGNKNVLIPTDADEFKQIKEILKSSNCIDSEIKYINETDILIQESKKAIQKYLRQNSISEIIFSLKTTDVKKIISLMKEISDYSVEIKIANPYNSVIIGSNSINQTGEYFATDIFEIQKSAVNNVKRLSDIIFSILFFIFFPVLVLLVEKKQNFFRNIFLVLLGKLSWVGYVDLKNDVQANQMPVLKKGVLSPANYSISDEEEINKLNRNYAKNYNLTDDIYIIYKSFQNIGNKKL